MVSGTFLRIGASADIRRRLVGYPVMDEIPGCTVTYAVVSDRFARRLAPLVRAYFGRRASPRPGFLVGKTLDYCEARELRSIEYKVERLLLEEYCRRQAGIQGSARRKDLLPPGNARTGSSREYLRDIQVVEQGATRVLDRPRALLQPEIADRFWMSP